MDKPTLTIQDKTYQIKPITIGEWLTISKYEDEKPLLSVTERIQTELDLLSNLFNAPVDVLSTLSMDETWPKYLEVIDYLVEVWASKLPKARSKVEEVVKG